MLISREMPELTYGIDTFSTWGFASPTSRLTDGRPRLGCRVARTAGAGGFQLRAEWSTPSKPKLIALLGLTDNCLGLDFSIQGRDPSTLSYTQSIGTLEGVRLADGSVAAICVVPAGSPAIDIDGVRFTFPGTFSAYTIGQLVIAEADEWSIMRQWAEGVRSLTVENVTLSGQPYNVTRPQVRTASVTLCPQSWERGYTSNSLQTMQELQARLSKRQPVLVVPALRAPGLGEGAAIDQTTVERTTLFGRATDIGQIELVNDSNLLQMRVGFTENPAGQIEA